MNQTRIDGHLFASMIFAGAANLRRNAKKVDDLNVFPVPDGDTGTNMTLSFASGSEELKKNPSEHLGKAAGALARGLLMGARGNSGVILSQLFRGFSKAVSEKAWVDAKGFAEAVQSGVDAAYKAVMKPVEGTILTVAREGARAGMAKARTEEDITLVMGEILRAAKEALANTPKLLPVLRQVGVVDAGGQGLVFVYEGFLSALRGEEAAEPSEAEGPASEGRKRAVATDEPLPAQLHMNPEEIEFGYCTEFILTLEKNRSPFDERSFRENLHRFGDSILVIADGNLVKVHIHAERPGEVLNFAQGFGEFKKIKLENMREQHQEIVNRHQERIRPNGEREQGEPSKPYGLLAVASGEGLERIFLSLGVDGIIPGGQTMNPSTEEIVRAVKRLHAEKVLILPNNGNIIMAAQQAKDLVDVPLEVIPSRSVPQGIAALLAFDPSQEMGKNVERMTEALSRVRTGQVTHAVRNSSFGGMEIAEGDYLGISEGEIVVTAKDMAETAQKLIRHMLDEDSAVLTIIYGEGIAEESARGLADFAREQNGDLEVEVLYGGQPVYSYILSVE